MSSDFHLYEKKSALGMAVLVFICVAVMGMMLFVGYALYMDTKAHSGRAAIETKRKPECKTDIGEVLVSNEDQYLCVQGRVPQ